MNCTEVNEKMADLFDNSVSPEQKDELFAHFKECKDCRELYEEMSGGIAELKPTVTIHASKNLHSRITDTALQSGKPFRSRTMRFLPGVTPAWKKVTAIAALLVLGLILFPVFNHSGVFVNKANAANSILENSINALSQVKSVYMEFTVRTRGNENFEYIDMKEKFVEHKLWRIYGNPSKWRVEKPGRTAVMDGKNQYLYVPGPGGFAIVGDTSRGSIEWMRILLDPGKILQTEKDAAARNEAKYEVTTAGNVITLTVRAKAIGDFRNAYALNKTIPESNNRRVYTFDKSTNLLKTLEIYIESDQKEIEILHLTSIKYNEPIADSKFVITLPSNEKWVVLEKIINDKNTGLAGVSSEEATQRFFEAWKNEDWKTVDQLMPGFLSSGDVEKVKHEFGGLKIVSIGKSFKSGQYPGEFIPYEVKLKSGSIKKMNLALRNDNADKKWIVDGGF